MIPVSINNDLKTYVPELILYCIESDVPLQSENPELWKIIETKTEELATTLHTEDII